MVFQDYSTPPSKKQKENSMSIDLYILKCWLSSIFSGFRETAYRDQQLRTGFWGGPQQEAERKDARWGILKIT